MCKVYALLCKDGSIYTRWTKDVQKRLKQHNDGKGAKYTKSHGPCTLLCTWECLSPSHALKLEYQIKKLSHEQKLILIENTKIKKSPSQK